MKKSKKIQCGQSITFAISPDKKGKTNQPFQFEAEQLGYVPPYAFDWNFGDGTTGTGENITHSYKKHGSYQVTVTIKDANGNVKTSAAQTILVEPLEAKKR